MKPTYYAYEDWGSIISEPPRDFEKLGKIVTYNNHIFINEKYKGIHVIDNSDPVHGKKIYFWVINGNTEFTVNGNVLYANNGRDLLVIDISDYAHIVVLKALLNQYEPEKLKVYPANYNGYFECFDPSKGLLKGWEKGTLINPNCKTI
ncbi:MAG: hypothetical protein R2774_04575 [Saprospiraceae bacterium]